MNIFSNFHYKSPCGGGGGALSKKLEISKEKTEPRGVEQMHFSAAQEDTPHRNKPPSSAERILAYLGWRNNTSEDRVALLQTY